MRTKILAFTTLALAAAAAQAEPTYLPVGAQANVSLSTVTLGGWTQCYASSFGTPIGNAAENVLNACQGDYLMMAGRATGANTFLALAAALRSETIQETGNTSVTHVANGANWWFSDLWSWGFTAAGDTVSNGSCDTSTSPLSMCLHTLNWTGGYRINNIMGLNGSNAYEKVFFVASRDGGNAVPEPGALAMVGLGLAAMGAITRRRKPTSAR